jgi:hypothetical protein
LCVSLFFNGKRKYQESVEFSVIEEGVELSHRPKGRELELFSTQQRFNDFYTRMHLHTLPRPDAPHIDFTRSIVVFITLGEKRSTGFSIDVRSVHKWRKSLIVKAIPVSPPQESLQAQMITYPYTLILVPIKRVNRVEWVNEVWEILETKSL